MPNIRLSQLMLSFFAVTVVACGGAPPPDDAVSDPLAETVATEPTPPPYRVYVTNESSGDLTVIAGGTHEVLATVPLGKRPRGLAVSPDGRQLFRGPERITAGAPWGLTNLPCPHPIERLTASVWSTSRPSES